MDETTIPELLEDLTESLEKLQQQILVIQLKVSNWKPPNTPPQWIKPK